MAIRYYHQHVNPRLVNRRKVSTFLQALIRRYRPELRKINLAYIFSHDDYVLEINRQFLDHDTFTDIITFDMSEEAEILEAEVYISIDRVQENAQKFKVTYEEELHRVIFHGALHLCGFKDKKPADKKAMRLAEDACLNAYFAQD